MKRTGRTVTMLAERLSRAVRCAKRDPGWSVDPADLRRTFARGSRAMGAATWGARARHPDGGIEDVLGFSPMGRFLRGPLLMVYDHVVHTWEVGCDADGPAGCVGVCRSVDQRAPPVWHDELTGEPVGERA